MSLQTPEHETLDRRQTLEAMSIVPTSVSVLAGDVGYADARAAMIIGSFVFISLEPCLVGFSVRQESSTWPLLSQAPLLGISTLAADQAELCHTIGRKNQGRFHDHLWFQGDAGAPLVAGAAAWIECQLDHVTRTGDHDFVLARVLGVKCGRNPDPLVFHNRRLTSIR